MKTVKIICTLIFVIVFSVAAHGANTDGYHEDRLEASGALELSEHLTKETEGYLERLGCGDMEFEKILDVSPKAVFSLLSDMLKGGIKEPLRAMLKATGIVMLVSVCGGFFPDDEKSRAVMNLVCGGVTATGVLVPAAASLRGAVSAMGVCATFEKALIPVLAGILTAGGNPVLALSFKGTAFAAAQTVEALAENFAMPLIGISGAMGITGAMLPTLRLNAVSELIRKTMTTVLACTAGLFTGFLSLKSILAASADSLAVKGVRMASSFVPVVGGALGEAVASVSASLSLIKNTVGIYAVAAFFLTGAPVVINLALWSFAMRGACAVSDLLDCRVCSEILKSISFIFSTANAVLLLCMAVFIISSGLVISFGG